MKKRMKAYMKAVRKMNKKKGTRRKESAYDSKKEEAGT
jgi:hypothetical protein